MQVRDLQKVDIEIWGQFIFYGFSMYIIFFISRMRNSFVDYDEEVYINIYYSIYEKSMIRKIEYIKYFFY